MHELSDRKKRILKSLIDEYIRSGEPVGSKYISGALPDSVSSATVRNEMSEMTELGYLDKPHTSAGRVPTAKALKTYVDGLMEEYKLSLEELELLNELLEYKVGEFGKLLSQAARALSAITNYTAISVLKPAALSAESFRAVTVDDESFLLLMKCTDGQVMTRTVKASQSDELLLKALEKALNGCLTGLTAEQVTLPVILRLEESAAEAKALVSPTLRAVYDMLGAEAEEDVQVEGITKLLSYPEFFDVSKAKQVLSVLEQKHALVSRLTGGEAGKPNLVMSGEGLESTDASVVYYPIIAGGKTVGAIGVIGPKRMDYKKVIASLEYFATGLSEEMNSKGDTDEDGE
ncbi:MAG: heat-inducible transcription repressor HrcA [Clostridia bacterium]|nr:heat-inducible transcription repressor HrcA [Clostridia bacterium]